MKKGTKIGIGVAGGILIAGGLIYLFRDKIFTNRAERKKCKQKGGKYNPKLKACMKEGQLITNESNGDGSNSGGLSSGGFICPYGATPFKSKEEGNKFRKWMNDYYPNVAKNIKGNGADIGLDPVGSYDNCHIREAYDKCKIKQGDKCNFTYGEAYTLALTRGDIK